MNSQTMSTVFHNIFPNWELALKYIKSYGSHKYWMSDEMYCMYFTKERLISFIW